MTMITRLLLAAFLALNVVLGAAQNALAQSRIALVIGNGAYAHVTPLHNPPNDAADVSQSLQRLGFNVTSMTDTTLDGLRHALIDFGRAARNADMAVLFFAGHGMELLGENWLLPIDTELTSDVDVATEAVSLRSAMLAVSNAKQLGLVILDACRNSPFFAKLHRPGPSPALEPGLAAVAPAENVLVAYSARDGTTASDGAGRNSPYTTALLQHLETPGLEIEFLFRNIRDDVMSATNGEQQPFVYGSLSSDEIYLKPGANLQLASNASEVTSDAGEIAWSFLKQTSDVDTLQRFVEAFPSSERLSDAKERLAKLEHESGPADQTYGPDFYSDGLDEMTRRTARKFLRNTPAVQAAWKVVQSTKDTSVLRSFSEQFPSRQHHEETRQRLVEIGAPTFSGDLLFKAATDPDVLQCYRDDDLTTPVCKRVLETFPDIRLFLLDFRFRYELCGILGGLGHCHDLWTAVRSKALFEPNKLPHSGPDLKATKESTPHVEHLEHKTAKVGETTRSRRLGRERFSKHVASHHTGSQERTHRGISVDHRSYGSQGREFGRQSGADEHAGSPDEHPGGHGRH
jgi:Caspase domain